MDIYQQFFWADCEQTNAFSPLSLSHSKPPHASRHWTNHGFGLDLCLPPGWQRRKWPSHLGRTSLPVPSVQGQVKLLQPPKYRRLIKSIVYIRINEIIMTWFCFARCLNTMRSAQHQRAARALCCSSWFLNVRQLVQASVLNVSYKTRH